MPKDLNRISLIGRLGVDPEMRYTKQGVAVTSFSLATSHQWKDSDGQLQSETTWHAIVAWNQLGEICGEYLRKGSRVYIEGRLQTRSWEDAETGQKHYKTEVVASDMIMLDVKRQEEAPPPPEPPMPSSSRQATRPTTPAQRPPAVAATARRRAAQPTYGDEDDLPF